MKKFALTISDGHENSWEYFNDSETQLNRFNELKKTEDDIHLYELNKNNEYEVTGYFWIEDENYIRATKEQAINDLVMDEIDTIQQLIYGDDVSYIAGMLRDGLKGFNNFSDENIIKYFRERFDDTLILI